MDADLAEISAAVEARGAGRFETYHTWDFTKFGRGERFVYKPSRSREFDEIFRQVERWGLAQYAKERAYENLVYPLGA